MDVLIVFEAAYFFGDLTLQIVLRENTTRQEQLKMLLSFSTHVEKWDSWKYML